MFSISKKTLRYALTISFLSIAITIPLNSESRLPVNLDEPACWKLEYQAIRDNDLQKAQKYINTIHAIRQKAGAKSDWELDLLTFILKEKLSYKDVVPEYTQKLLLLFVKRYRFEVSLPKRAAKADFEKKILPMAVSDYYRKILAKAYTLTKTGEYIYNENTGPEDNRAVGDLLIHANYQGPGEKYVRARELTDSEMKQMRLNYLILKLYVEALSKGKLSLDIREEIIENTLTRLAPEPAVGSDGRSSMLPVFESMTPYPYEFLYSILPETDIIAWHFPPTMARGWHGMGGIHYFPLVPDLLLSPIRGAIWGSSVNPLGNIVHEYCHTVERACGIRYMDMSDQERKKLNPAWPMATDFTMWYFSEVLPKRMADERKKSGGPGWRMFSFAQRHPFRLIRGILDFNNKIAKEVPRENIIKARELYKKGIEQKVKNRYAEAIAFFNEALGLNPYEYRSLEHAGFCHAWMKDFDAADRCFRKNLAIPSEEQFHFLMAKVFLDERRYENALYYFEEGFKATANPGYLKWMAEVYQKLNKPDKAAECQGRLPRMQPIDRKNWKIIYCDSEEMDGENRSAKNAIDGNPDTFWNNRYKKSGTPHPHEIIIDMGKTYTISGFAYLPTMYCSGRIKDYEFYVSSDGTFGDPFLQAAFPGDFVEKIVQFKDRVTCRFIKIRTLSDTDGWSFANIAELNVFGE